MKIFKQENELVVKYPKAGLIWYFVEMLSYAIGFFLVCIVIWKNSETKLGIRISLIAIISIVYLLITIRQKKFKNLGFKIQIVNNEIVVNKQHTKFRQISSISFKTSVSTYSAEVYYDINIKIGNTEYQILSGVNESDMNLVIKALNEFNGSEIKVVTSKS